MVNSDALNFLDRDNYGRFNYCLVKLLNLECAVYIEELLSINGKAKAKGMLDTSGYFKMTDRKRIEERLGLSKARQHEIDQQLSGIEIVHISSTDNDTIYLDLDKLTNLVYNTTQIEKSGIGVLKTRETQKKNKEAKDNAIKRSLYELINCESRELQVAFCTWIDEVYSVRPISKTTVTEAQNQINIYCAGANGQYDLNKALRLVKIATSNHYTEMSWAYKTFVEEARTASYDKYQQTKEVMTPKAAPTVPVGIDIHMFDKSKQF